MQKNNTSSLVEAGILAAVAVVFATISIYVPVLGVFLNIFWPVPLILLGVRHGLKWSVMALITAGLLLGITVSPWQSITQVIWLGPVGITLGYCLGKGKGAALSILCGSAASFLSKVAVLILSLGVMGVNPLELSPETLNKTIRDTAELYRSFGMSESEIERGQTSLTTTLELMKLILPAGFILASVIDTWINFSAFRAISKRLGTNIPGLPLFKNWAMPKSLLLLYGLSLITVSLTQANPAVIYNTIALNATMIFTMPILLQGIAVCWFIIEKRGWPGFLKGILVALLFLTGVAPFTVIFVGMLDYIFDFRKIRAK